MIPLESKECSACHRILPLESFWKATRGLYGRKSRCIECLRRWEKDHPEGRRAQKARQKAKYRANHPLTGNPHGLKGIKKSPETITRMCLAQQARREDISRTLRGRPVSVETRRKIGAANSGPSPLRGYKHTGRARLNMSLSQRGKRLTPEHKIKLGESRKRAWALIVDRAFTLDHRRAISRALMGRKASSEHRERLCAARARQRQPFNGSVPEILTRKFLISRGVTFQCQASVPGVPFHRFDIVVPSRKLAIEVDGCYWHGCPTCTPNPSAAPQFERDRCIEGQLAKTDWNLVRIWEHATRAGEFSALTRALRE
jgi:G:T-mismatch repair DNA endonuclease (very short patch repair protein)